MLFYARGAHAEEPSPASAATTPAAPTLRVTLNGDTKGAMLQRRGMVPGTGFYYFMNAWVVTDQKVEGWGGVCGGECGKEFESSGTYRIDYPSAPPSPSFAFPGNKKEMTLTINKGSSVMYYGGATALVLGISGAIVGGFGLALNKDATVAYAGVVGAGLALSLIGYLLHINGRTEVTDERGEQIARDTRAPRAIAKSPVRVTVGGLVF
jgi:hypothetical protein